jgi:uncharacterized tellurite resistance protein B-like protein
MSSAAAEAQFESGLTSKLISVFDSGFDSRKQYYAANPSERPKLADIDGLISRYANINAAIAGGLSLVPGPWGLLAAIPQIVLVVQNQVKMIYDISVASGKEEVVTRELVLGIALSASGSSMGSLITMHGGRYLVRRSSLQVFQALIQTLGGQITQQVLKKSIIAWLPVVGAAAIAIWTRYSTAAIGQAAKEIFAKEIVLEGAEASDSPGASTPPSASTSSSDAVLIAKLLLLDDLARCDGDVSAREGMYIAELTARCGLSDAGRRAILDRLREPSPRVVDLAPFRADRSEAVGLLIDLAALARRDGVIHPAERAFVERVAGLTGIETVEIDAAFAV